MDRSSPRQTDLSVKELLRPDEVEAIYGWPVGTQRQWRYTGKGPKYCKSGPSRSAPVAYRRSDIEAWLDEQTVDPAAKAAA